jgi:tol-pal system protein YbgF
MLLGLPLLLLLAGCASRGEIETMKRQLDYLERSSTQMQDRIVELDSLNRATVDRNVAYQADLKVALSELIDKTSTIDGRLADIEKRISAALGHTDQPAGRALPPTGTQPGATADSSASGQLPQVDPKKLYNNAFTDLRTGNYDLAIMEFNEYLSLFPDNPQAAEAQYWLGECYYGKKEYARAIPEFEKMEKNYPASDKLEEGLYKLARSYEETGTRQKAKSILQRIVKDYPKSLVAKQAQDRLKDLQ